MNAGLIAAGMLGHMGASLGGSALSYSWGKREASKAFKRSLWADSTKYQRAVSDLKAAGLSPILATRGLTGSAVPAQAGQFSMADLGRSGAAGAQAAAQGIAASANAKSAVENARREQLFNDFIEKNKDKPGLMAMLANVPPRGAALFSADSILRDKTRGGKFELTGESIYEMLEALGGVPGMFGDELKKRLEEWIESLDTPNTSNTRPARPGPTRKSGTRSRRTRKPTQKPRY